MIRRSLISAAVAVMLTMVALPSIASAGGYCADPSAFSAAETTHIEIQDFCFTPTVAYVRAGDTVTFVNRDMEVHNLGGVNDIFGNLHEEVAPNATLSFRFEDEGVFPFLCIIHPGMAGAIVVGDGRGDLQRASIVGVPGGPEAGPDTAAAAAPAASTSSASKSGPGMWLVVTGIALGLGVAGFAAIPRRRATTP
jgi:plastocyanin